MRAQRGQVRPAGKIKPSGLRAFLSEVKKKRITEIIAGFVGGGWLVYEIVHWVLVVHYHLPEKLLDITLITLIGLLLITLIWRWFAGRGEPGKFKPELILISVVGLTILVINFNLILKLQTPAANAWPGPQWKKSLAVLPFADLSPQGNQEYFCDGMTEEIISQLSRIGDLKVISRTSVVHYRNSQMPIKEIARELGVGNILEGSVRREGEMVRVSAQLIDSETGFQLWSEKYDRKLSGVFAIQDEISQAIANALKVKLSAASLETIKAGRPENMKLYETYLQGMYFINSRYVLSYEEEDFVKALEMFEEARTMDPAYARTYLGIAWAYWHRYVITEDEEDLKQCLTNGETAYQLNPETAESNLSKGFVYFIRGEYDKAFEKYRSAFERGPNSHVVYMGIGYSLSEVGLFESAIPFLLKSIELAPLYIFSRTQLATCYRGVGEFEKAEAYLKDVLNLNPRNPLCLSHLVKHMIVVGRYEEAEEFLAELEKVAPEFYLLPAHKAQLLAARGEREKALALDRSPIVYSLLGMKAEAVKAIQKEISEGVLYPYLSLINDPRFRNLEDDPTFRSIVARAENSHRIFLKKYGSYF